MGNMPKRNDYFAKYAKKNTIMIKFSEKSHGS